MTSRLVPIAATAILALAAVGRADAQEPIASGVPIVRGDSSFDRDWPQHPSHLLSCLASTPLDQMKRTSVYLRAIIEGSDRSALTAQTDLMAQEVAESMRMAMGGTADSLPNGDRAVNPWGVPSELIVIAHPDGSVRRYSKSRTTDTTATVLLAKAFDAARAHGDALLVWPDGYSADSLIVRLILEAMPLNSDGTMRIERHVNSEFGVFRIPEPIEVPALARMGNPPPRYPAPDHIRRVEGYILLQFVVDSLGRAVPGTIRDLWPENKPRLTGELLRYYEDFVGSAEEVLPSWRFYPAHIGNCRVSQIVQLPISYQYSQHSPDPSTFPPP